MNYINFSVILTVILLMPYNAISKGYLLTKEGSIKTATSNTKTTDTDSNLDLQQRSYITYIPSGYNSNYKHSLVIMLHGGFGNAEIFQQGTMMDVTANYFNFLVVYPQGTENYEGSNQRFWNAGTCCSTASYNNIDDIKFIEELIVKITNEYNINQNKIYIFGHSNGAMMAYRFACERPDIVKSIVAVSGTTLQDTCSDNQNLSVFAIHGADDKYVKIDGSSDTDTVDYNSMQQTKEIIESAESHFESRILDNVGHKLYEIQRHIYDSDSKILEQVAYEFMKNN
jgi:poly(3-hydroxybutyrate) depolymerase